MAASRTAFGTLWGPNGVSFDGFPPAVIPMRSMACSGVGALAALVPAGSTGPPMAANLSFPLRYCRRQSLGIVRRRSAISR